MSRAASNIALRATGVSILSGSGYATYLYNTDEGTSRMMQAYSTFIPVILHYRILEARNKLFPSTVSKQDWIDMDHLYAKPTIQKLGELQGMYCKYGQMAAGFTNSFSEIWLSEFRKLESEVPPRSVEVVYKTIQEEMKKPVEEIFEYFDPKPLGSASIGQVHRARFKHDGKEVAVKVQYPEASKLFRDDMKTIRIFCEYLAPENVVTLSALEKQNADEVDYRIEAKNLMDVTKNMKNSHFIPNQAVIPQPFQEYSTKRMLTMDLIPGPKLVDGIRNYFSQWAERHGTTLKDLEDKARKKIEKEGIPAKYSGPTAKQIELYKKYIRAKDLILNVGVFTHNLLLKRELKYYNTTIPLNIPQIIDTLMNVHGHQMLKDGVFNADPHGGNFLLLPDGRIGLIDYGATKTLNYNERLATCLLYVALYRNDEQMLWDMCQLGGYKSKYGKRNVLMKLLRFGYDSWGKDVMEGKNIQQFIDGLKEEDPWEEVPDNFVMAQFMSIRLRSLALSMNHPVRCSEYWGPMAEEILIEEGLPYETWDMKQLKKYTPKNLNMQSFKFG